jgi:hypothetical protein
VKTLKADSHLTDQELVLVADGEASRRSTRRAYAHLVGCGECRSRLAELEETIAAFVSLHKDSVAPEAVSGPRALLKATLAQAAAEQELSRPFAFLSAHRRYAYLSVALTVVLLGAGLVLHRAVRSAPSREVASITIPDPKLTPGATRPVSLGDVCSMEHEEVVRAVPGSVRDQVFREYGIVNPKPQDYEIDYLIAPGLGGADDIHNLWPEPEASGGWNSHDKDVLEERLHQMVCSGQLDLSTAQKAIASDWIQAYKKYLPKSA